MINYVINYICFGAQSKFQMAKKKKEQYIKDMELYKQNKDEAAANLKKEEEELMKLHKQEALQLLKKKEKTENLIKVEELNTSYL